LMRWTPRMFVCIAFDSGGIAAGALTSAFITPLALGIAQEVAKAAGPDAQSILVNGFGMIAFICVTAMIAVQTLGMIYDRRMKVAQVAGNQVELETLDELMKHR